MRHDFASKFRKNARNPVVGDCSSVGQLCRPLKERIGVLGDFRAAGSIKNALTWAAALASLAESHRSQENASQLLLAAAS
jgi:hypothetical protein